MGRGDASHRHAREHDDAVGRVSDVRRALEILRDQLVTSDVAAVRERTDALAGALDVPLKLIALDELRGQADPDSLATLLFASRRQWAKLGAPPEASAALDACIALLAPIEAGAAVRARSAAGRGSVLRASGRYRQCHTDGCVWAIEAAAPDGSALWLCHADVVLV